MSRRAAIWGAVLMASLFIYPIACMAEAAMKTCPIDRAQMENEVPCPRPGGELRRVTPEKPQEFHFCSICKECWTGVVLEADKDYQIRVLADPDTWADGPWQAATAAEALEGWGSLSDIPATQWWEHVVKGPFVWWGARSRRVPQADWFQVFFVVRDTAGTETQPVRLERLEQAFTPPIGGELYFFANDHPKFYERNNTGRMSLEISLARYRPAALRHAPRQSQPGSP